MLAYVLKCRKRGRPSWVTHLSVQVGLQSFSLIQQRHAALPPGVREIRNKSVGENHGGGKGL